MKKQILKTSTIIGLIFSSNLLAITPPTPEEYQEIVDSFKLVNTSKKELSKTYKINGEKIKLELEKENDDEEWQNIQHIIRIEKTSLIEQKSWRGIYKYDQKLFAVTCISDENKIFIASVVQSSFKRGKEIHFGALVSQIDDNAFGGNQSFGSEPLTDKSETTPYTQIPTYNPKEFYPYYNEEKILNRLYETGTCDKELTQKANIEVLVGNKWIPQEQSWNIKEEMSNNINSSSKNPSITLNQLLENSKTNQKVSIEDINDVFKNETLNTKTVQKYNDIAYYLQQVNANDEAIFLLEKIIEKFPNRTVAYLNLADAYNGINDKKKAKENYEKYINLMKQDNKEAKIPKRVLEYK